MVSMLKPLLVELAAQCRADPTRAVAESGAVCGSEPGDPLKWTVTGSPSSVETMTSGQHPLLGGDGSGPCPGELLAMAIASCMDGTIRGIADLLEVQLESIRVEVVNRADIRQFLRAMDVPEPDTGISMHVRIRPRPGEDEGKVAKLRAAAEQGSAVLNLVRSGAPVSLSWDA